MLTSLESLSVVILPKCIVLAPCWDKRFSVCILLLSLTFLFFTFHIRHSWLVLFPSINLLFTLAWNPLLQLRIAKHALSSLRSQRWGRGGGNFGNIWHKDLTVHRWRLIRFASPTGHLPSLFRTDRFILRVFGFHFTLSFRLPAAIYFLFRLRRECLHENLVRQRDL